MAKKIYLSPSNQNSNTYATGNTNEMEQCNRIADYAKKALERCGFSVKKAPKGQNMNTSISESNSWGADLHIPIHTNAGGGKGTEVFIYSNSGENKKAGNAVYKRLVEVNATKTARYIGTYRYGGTLAEIQNTTAIAVYCECEFHDNKTYAKYIIDNAKKFGEAICKGVCDYYGVTYKSSTSTSGSTTSSKPVSKPVSKPTTSNSSSGNSSIKSVQTWLNSNYKTGLVIDGIYGSNTKKALVKAMQTEMNKQYGSKLVVDGIYGSATNSAVRNLTVGCKGNITKTLQGLLICNGYSTNGFDGIYGNGTTSAVKSYQTKHDLTADGIAGKATFSSLCK